MTQDHFKLLNEISKTLLKFLFQKKRITIEEKEFLTKLINDTHNIANLKVLVRILGDANFLGNAITLDTIIKEFEKQKIFDNYVEKHFN